MGSSPISHLLLSITHYKLSTYLIRKTYLALVSLLPQLLTSELKLRSFTLGFYIKASTKRYSSNTRNITPIFCKFAPLMLASIGRGTRLRNPSISNHIVSTKGGVHSVALSRSFSSFSRITLFLEFIISCAIPLFTLSNRLLYGVSSLFNSYKFIRVSYIRAPSLIKFFSNRLALLSSPRTVLKVLEMLAVNTILVLDAGYHLRLLSLFSRKGLFTIGLLEASTNSHALSLPFLVTKSGLLQQLLFLKMLFFIKSKSAETSFSSLKTLAYVD